MSPRMAAVMALVLLSAATLVTAWARVPWHLAPAPRADQVAALGDLPRDAVARGRAFHAELRPPNYAAMVAALVVALVLGFSSWGARLVALFGGNWIVRAVLGGLAVGLVSGLVTVPFSAWQRTITRRYGLSTQSWGGWAVDVLKGYLVAAVLGALALLGFYTITRLAPRWWWAFAAAGAALLVGLLSFVFPVLVEPIFNKFTPMPDGPLRSELMTMAQRDGVPVRDVLVADASRRTRAVNAYVSGFGATRRIVVYDTLLEQADPAEVVSVVAHELGHAKDGDVITGTLLGALGAAGTVTAVYLLGFWTALLRRAGIDSVAEPRSIALLLALVAVLGVFSGPLQSMVSRHVEARADAHALALTGDPDAFAAMQARLSALNLSDPDPNRIEYLLFASHPSTVQRIAAARAYARGQR